MSNFYFKPWIGERYSQERVLIMSESTYDWTGEDGKTYTPSPEHALEGIPWHIENFKQNAYFTAMNRALTGNSEPSAEQMREAWEQYAYTIFVQSSVGTGAGVRPRSVQWKHAQAHFREKLEELRPKKLIVTGGDMWSQMPDCDVHLVKNLEAYRLRDGQLVWCLALPHPSNRTQGFAWEEIAIRVRIFRETAFPLRFE